MVTISSFINKKELLKENPKLKKHMIDNPDNALVEITPSTRTFIDEFGTIMLSVGNIKDLLAMFDRFKTKESNLENFENMFDFLLNRVDFVDSMETSSIIH